MKYREYPNSQSFSELVTYSFLDGIPAMDPGGDVKVELDMLFSKEDYAALIERFYIRHRQIKSKLLKF